MKKVTGLDSQEAHRLLKEHGPNLIREEKKSSPLKVLLRQIQRNFIVYLLVVASVLSFAVGKQVTAITILLVVVAVVGTGFFQEYKAEKAVEALKKLLTKRSRVIRDGQEEEVLSEVLVPGDIIILSTGEMVPADAEVLEEDNLRIDESILTGESEDIPKGLHSPIYMGTFVTTGRCTAKIISTGMSTEFGKIAGMVSATQKTLPLQNKINGIAKYMVVIAVSVAILTGAVNIFYAGSITTLLIENTIILMIALAVSAFPEGFPVVLTTTLAVGVSRMAAQNAIVNRMSVIESLGEVTVIAADKTGTITNGQMTARKIILDGEVLGVEDIEKTLEHSEQLKLLVMAGVMCNDASFVEDQNGGIKPTGSATETALLVMGRNVGVEKNEAEYTRIEEFPFSSERKMMSVIVKNDSRMIFAKGAPETILARSKSILKDKKLIDLTIQEKEKLLKENSLLTNDAMRTIALAYKIISNDTISQENAEKDLIFLGIVGIEDPPRDEAKDAILACQKAGITVKLITGDHAQTAEAIAKQVGIKGFVMTGEEIENSTDRELAERVMVVNIFARVLPEQKLRIVKALKDNGEIVAMTGDGVNDAPALKEAHVGVAMGTRGTDVARFASDLILKDDNFATIVSAIVEGRTIFNNIRKFTSYQLSCNFAELGVIFIGVLIAPFLGWEVPVLLAIQILFMNLITDNLPSITLGFNPTSKDIMVGKMRHNTPIVDRQLVFLIFITGSLMAFFTLFAHYLSLNIFNHSIEFARTTALVTLILVEVAGAFIYRSFRKGVLTRSPFVNKYLFLASALSILLTIVIVYTPASKIFETVPIYAIEWFVALVFGFTLIIIFDFLKAVNNKLKLFPNH